MPDAKDKGKTMPAFQTDPVIRVAYLLTPDDDAAGQGVVVVPDDPRRDAPQEAVWITRENAQAIALVQIADALGDISLSLTELTRHARHLDGMTNRIVNAIGRRRGQ